MTNQFFSLLLSLSTFCKLWQDFVLVKKAILQFHKTMRRFLRNIFSREFQEFPELKCCYRDLAWEAWAMYWVVIWLFLSCSLIVKQVAWKIPSFIPKSLEVHWEFLSNVCIAEIEIMWEKNLSNAIAIMLQWSDRVLCVCTFCEIELGWFDSSICNFYSFELIKTCHKLSCALFSSPCNAFQTYNQADNQ